MVDLGWASDLVDAVAATIGWDRVDGVEIGNEEDLFYENGIRSPNYTLSDYEGELRAYLNVRARDEFNRRVASPPRLRRGSSVANSASCGGQQRRVPGVAAELAQHEGDRRRAGDRAAAPATARPGRDLLQPSRLGRGAARHHRRARGKPQLVVVPPLPDVGLRRQRDRRRRVAHGRFGLGGPSAAGPRRGGGLRGRGHPLRAGRGQ